MKTNKSRLKNWFLTYVGAFALLLAFGLSVQSCGSESGQTYTIEKQFPTQGVITYMKEVNTNEFKITNEELVADTSASMVITEFQDGTVDTMSLSDIKISATQTDHPRYYQHSSMSSVLMGGMMGYWMGRSLSAPIMPGSYYDRGTYNKVNTSSAQTMKSTARTVRSTRPSGSRSGFGKSSSSRSYGG